METARERRHMAVERENLAKAELNIVEGERRITKLMVEIDRMRERGRDVTKAEELLTTLRDTLSIRVMHRDTILLELEQHHACPDHREAAGDLSGAPRHGPPVTAKVREKYK